MAQEAGATGYTFLNNEQARQVVDGELECSITELFETTDISAVPIVDVHID